MDLTPVEIKYAEKYIHRLEKDSRQWPWMRWLYLVGSILFIGTGIYIFNKLRNITELVSSTILITPNTLNSEAVELFVKGQLLNLLFEIYYMVGITLQELVGIWWLIYCLVNWNRHLRSAIMVKAFHRLLSEK